MIIHNTLPQLTPRLPATLTYDSKILTSRVKSKKSYTMQSNGMGWLWLWLWLARFMKVMFEVVCSVRVRRERRGVVHAVKHDAGPACRVKVPSKILESLVLREKNTIACRYRV